MGFKGCVFTCTPSRTGYRLPCPKLQPHVPTINAVLRKNKTNAKGTAPVYLRFSDVRSTRYVSLGIRVKPSQWNDRQGKVRKSHANEEALNALIADRLAEAQGEVLDAKRDGETATPAALKSALTHQAERDADFLAYAMGQAELLESEGRSYTARKWRSITGKLRRFLATPRRNEDAATLPFSELTPDVLAQFEAHLRAPKPKGWGNAPNTVRDSMRVLKIIYNRAVRDETAQHLPDPFRRYKPPKGTKARRHKLALEEVKRMEALELPTGGYLWHARNYFLFAFYTGGIRFGDVAKMRREALHVTSDGTYLRYKQSKTGSAMTMQLVPPALALLERYPSDAPERKGSPFLFPMLDGADRADAKETARRIASANALINKALKRIASLAGIEEKVSFHIARHSFADLARRSGWDLTTIMGATGHRTLSSLETYLKGFDQDRLDDSMNNLFG